MLWRSDGEPQVHNRVLMAGRKSRIMPQKGRGYAPYQPRFSRPQHHSFRSTPYTWSLSHAATVHSRVVKVQRLVCISGPPAQSLMPCMLQCDPAARPERGRLTKISQPVSISRGGTDTLISFRCIMEFSVRVSYLVVYIVRLLTLPLYPSLSNLRRTSAVVFAYLVSGDGRS